MTSWHHILPFLNVDLGYEGYEVILLCLYDEMPISPLDCGWKRNEDQFSRFFLFIPSDQHNA